MKLTKESNKLMSFFVKNNCLLTLKQSGKTKTILKQLYNDINNGISYINKMKTKLGNSFFKLKVERITNVNQIPKPSTFPPNAFPSEIIKHIDEYSISLLTYNFKLFDRDISIIFITEDEHIENLIDLHNNYVTYMLVWLYIADIYSSKKCAKKLKIFVYHTSLLKNLPTSNINILNENNVNTAFTRTCPIDSEIVVFRKEEWFKVFIHETFHNFGLDFSGLTQYSCNKIILDIFPVNSEVNLYESYTEFWARIMNSLFCSFIHMKDKTNIDEFLKNTVFFIHLERIFAFFQMVKVLDFMDLTYDNLYTKSAEDENIRKTWFKEDTNVLSYYILTTILINNYQDTLSWCNTHNTVILNFTKTTANINEFCELIRKKYKSKNMLDNIDCMEMLLHRMKKSKRGRDVASITYLLKNLRMTICELG